MEANEAVVNELKLLNDILAKKTEELEIVAAISENQETLIESPYDWDDSPKMEERTFIFKEMSAEKQKHIDEVLNCDNVFQSIYDAAKDKIELNASAYKEYLTQLQQHIEVVLELDVRIRAQETKNRTILQNRHAEMRAASRQAEQKSVSDEEKNRILLKYKQNNKQ